MARNVLVDAGFVVALLSSRDAHHQWTVTQASELPPPWTGRLHTYRERGASREADREVFQRSHGLRRCLPRSHDRNACRSHHPHYRPRFPSLPSPQPPSGSLCDTRVILPPLISAETEPGLSAF